MYMYGYLGWFKVSSPPFSTLPDTSICRFALSPALSPALSLSPAASLTLSCTRARALSRRMRERAHPLSLPFSLSARLSSGQWFRDCVHLLATLLNLKIKYIREYSFIHEWNVWMIHISTHSFIHTGRSIRYWVRLCMITHSYINDMYQYSCIPTLRSIVSALGALAGDIVESQDCHADWQRCNALRQLSPQPPCGSASQGKKNKSHDGCSNSQCSKSQCSIFPSRQYVHVLTWHTCARAHSHTHTHTHAVRFLPRAGTYWHDTHTHKHTHTHTHTHKHTHTHTHTHTLSLSLSLSYIYTHTHTGQGRLYGECGHAHLRGCAVPTAHERGLGPPSLHCSLNFILRCPAALREVGGEGRGEGKRARQQHCSTLQHTATHCNTLQHTATHCTATHRWRRREQETTRGRVRESGNIESIHEPIVSRDGGGEWGGFCVFSLWMPRSP